MMCWVMGTQSQNVVRDRIGITGEVQSDDDHLLRSEIFLREARWATF